MSKMNPVTWLFHFFESMINGAYEAQFFFWASLVHLIKDTDSM